MENFFSYRISLSWWIDRCFRHLGNLALLAFLLCSACSPAATTPVAPTLVIASTTSHTPTTSPALPTASPTLVPTPPTSTLTLTATSTPPPSPTPEPPVRFAVIGDYGEAGIGEKEVSDLVHAWKPDFIITVGDNNYPSGAADTIDQNIGQYYHDFIFPYKGNYGAGATTNRFFPSLGNHDWFTAGARPYLDYFTLPGTELYYSFEWGPVAFFAVDSDYHDPAGITATSRQAAWLKDALASSTAPWKLVYFHLPPYSSGSVHGSTPELQWPFKAWGASAVLSGHDHSYERLSLDGLPYFVDGLGGNGRYAFNPTPVPGSQVRYSADYGALLVTATHVSITFEFYNGQNQLIDTYVMIENYP